jgi:hypothetical protein
MRKKSAWKERPRRRKILCQSWSAFSSDLTVVTLSPSQRVIEAAETAAHAIAILLNCAVGNVPSDAALERVLVPTTAADHSRFGAEVAVAIAKGCGAMITALNISAPPAENELLRRPNQLLLTGTRSPCRDRRSRRAGRCPREVKGICRCSQRKRDSPPGDPWRSSTHRSRNDSVVWRPIALWS